MPVSIFDSQKKTEVHGGKKMHLRPERNVGRLEQERSAMGNKFQIVGAAKANKRRALAERMSGTMSKCLSRDHRFLEEMCGVRRSHRGSYKILKCSNVKEEIMK